MVPLLIPTMVPLSYPPGCLSYPPGCLSYPPGCLSYPPGCLLPTRVPLSHLPGCLSHTPTRVPLPHPRVNSVDTSHTHGLTVWTPLIPTGCTRREATYPRGVQGGRLPTYGVYTRVYLSYLRAYIPGCTSPTSGCILGYMPLWVYQEGVLLLYVSLTPVSLLVFLPRP